MHSKNFILEIFSESFIMF